MDWDYFAQYESLDNARNYMNTDILNNYKEFMIEYDSEALVVYVSGLDDDGFWFDILIEDEVNNPEEYAQGYADALKAKGFTAQISRVLYD